MHETIDFLSPVTTRFVLALIAAAIVAYLTVRLSGGRAHQLAQSWPLYLLRGLLLFAVLALLFNPVRVTEQMGSVEPSQVFFMLDASESMSIGDGHATRWDQAVNLIRDASKEAHETAATEIKLFRFGRRLKAVDSPADLGLADSLADDGRGVSFARKAQQSDEAPAESSSPANEPDTQMLVALRQISSRFGRKPPAAVVVFSDGRARDAAQAEQVAATFAELGIPVHAAPVGNTQSGGDIAFVSLVVPVTARKQSEVQAQAFLRSYGFDGKQVQVRLDALDSGRRRKRLATIPVTLRSGFQSVPITFRIDADTRLLEANVSSEPNEVSTDNNRIDAEIIVSREKIRVLYVEGSRVRAVPVTENDRVFVRAPATSLQQAMQEDVDIECVIVQVSVEQILSSSTQMGTFPSSVAELSAFDAVILSDVSRRTFSPKQLVWIENWVRRRGGGLCMVGGRNSFASGQWAGSPLERMLPVRFADEFDWRGDVNVSLRLDLEESLHPLFQMTPDEKLSRQVAANFPGFHGSNVGLLPKPDLSQVLAVANPDSMVPVKSRPDSPLFSAQGIRELFTQRPQEVQTSAEMPSEFAAITVGQYGKGRTMAMAVPITGNAADEFLNWGRSEAQNQYYSQFWRNVAYWLTEQSFIGRRRLVARVDKRYYGPGETITLTGSVFDESANETTEYRLVGMIEPQSFDDIAADSSIIRWPNNVPRIEESESPFIFWGEEFEIPVTKIGGRDQYQIELTLAETLTSSTSNQSLRLELTAYEDYTQVDSTSVPIQILHDPFEQQNPFPDHEFLASLARESGGQVLENANALADMLTSLPVVRGPSEHTKAPTWSNWWVLCSLIGLISAEWSYRRWIGMA